MMEKSKKMIILSILLSEKTLIPKRGELRKINRSRKWNSQMKDTSDPPGICN